MSDQDRAAACLTAGYSLEVAPRTLPALEAAAGRIAPGTSVFIPYLSAEDTAARLLAAERVRALGFAPVLHLPARRLASRQELDGFVKRAVAEAGVDTCFVIGGDAAVPVGPVADSLALIETGVLEDAGLTRVGVAGHPDRHAVMSEAARWEFLARKCEAIEARGLEPLIVTQFEFDADRVLQWLSALRQRGIEHPVRIGVAGPARISVLARYAAMCGVSAGASVLSKYGLSIGKLLGSAGPDRFVDRLDEGLSQAHGAVQLHLFPFGGIDQSVDWVARYRAG